MNTGIDPHYWPRNERGNFMPHGRPVGLVAWLDSNAQRVRDRVTDERSYHVSHRRMIRATIALHLLRHGHKLQPNTVQHGYTFMTPARPYVFRSAQPWHA